MYDFSGKVALVTGSGGQRGIGRTIAIRLAKEGANVVVNDLGGRDSESGGLATILEEIQALGRDGLAIEADITDSHQIDNMVARIIDKFGRVDILVNNAAARHELDLVPVVDLDEKSWDITQEVNVKGTFLCSKAVAREMIRVGEGGKIVVISSIAGRQGIAERAAYCASKFAVIGFAQSLALELAQYGINVNTVCPGMVDTERIDHMAKVLMTSGESIDSYRQKMVEHGASTVPFGRVAQSSDVAKTVAFLCSKEAEYLTGLSVNVSGGLQLM